MSYAQTAYPQIQGINGKYSIHDIGCFLTSFANLELDYGKAISPLDINDSLRDRGLFVDVDDGVRDDVDWNFVNYIDGDTRVSRRGSGGWPNSNQAIVKFAYTHNGVHSTHFCKVQDWNSLTILDSWDGVVKHVSSTWYGQPVEWAVYEHGPIAPPVPLDPPFHIIANFSPAKWVTVPAGTHRWHMDHRTFQEMQAHPVYTVATTTNIQAQQLVQHNDGYQYYLENPAIHEGYNVSDCPDYTPPKPPAPPVAVPLAEKLTLVTALEYYADAKAAKERRGGIGMFADGEYIVIATDEQAKKLVRRNMDTVGYWINTFDNKLPKPVPDIPQPAEVPTLPVDLPTPHNETVDVSDNSIAPAAKVKFQYAMIKPVIMESNVSTPEVFYDLEQPDKRPTVTLNVNSSVEFSMTATDPTNGDVYYIPTVSMKKGYRHGIPEHCLITAHSSLDLNHNGRNDLLDIEQYAVDDVHDWTKYLETGFQTAKVFITDVIKPETLQPVVERSKQFSKGVMDIVAKKKGK